MKKKHVKTLSLVLLGFVSMILTSCSSSSLVVSHVGYQSVRTTFRQPTEIPDDAEILVVYGISEDGKIVPIVNNCTSEIMILDQTMSFFVNTNGQSTSYYDPTVRTTTSTDISSGTTGASVNLGAIGGALGIGGTLGGILNGINVGGSETSGTSTSNTTILADQPRISLAPKSKGALSKSFTISGLGTEAIKSANGIEHNLTPNNATLKFSVCISYSIDGGNTFKKIVSDFYVNNRIIIPVTSKGKVNDSLRNLFSTKPDAMDEPWWILHFANNVDSGIIISKKSDTMKQGVLYDYQ